MSVERVGGARQNPECCDLDAMMTQEGCDWSERQGGRSFVYPQRLDGGQDFLLVSSEGHAHSEQVSMETGKQMKALTQILETKNKNHKYDFRVRLLMISYSQFKSGRCVRCQMFYNHRPELSIFFQIGQRSQSKIYISNALAMKCDM